jgi:hypothetical protein
MALWTHSSKFFLATRSHKMTPLKGLEMFWFFWIIYSWFSVHFQQKRHKFAQNLEDVSKGLCIETRADMCTARWYIIYVSVFPSVQNVVSIATSQKT